MMVTVQATQSFATMVAGSCVSIVAGRTVTLPKGQADELRAAGFVIDPVLTAPEKKGHVEPGRVVGDAVKDPDDITDEEFAGKHGTAAAQTRAASRAAAAEARKPAPKKG